MSRDLPLSCKAVPRYLDKKIGDDVTEDGYRYQITGFKMTSELKAQIELDNPDHKIQTRYGQYPRKLNEPFLLIRTEWLPSHCVD